MEIYEGKAHFTGSWDSDTSMGSSTHWWKSRNLFRREPPAGPPGIFSGCEPAWPLESFLLPVLSVLVSQCYSVTVSECHNNIDSYSTTSISIYWLCMKLYWTMRRRELGRAARPTVSLGLAWRELVTPHSTLRVSPCVQVIFTRPWWILREERERREDHHAMISSLSVSLSCSQHDCWLLVTIYLSLTVKGKLRITSQRSLNFAMNKYYDTLSRVVIWTFNRNVNIHNQRFICHTV